MADMARFLIIYHYGGIYMDLDFYCHKPFSCLIESLSSKYLPKNTLASTNTNSSLFVVSLEPRVHGLLFRSKPRVVIQDFFLRLGIVCVWYSVCMYVYIKCMYLVYIYIVSVSYYTLLHYMCSVLFIVYVQYVLYV